MNISEIKKLIERIDGSKEKRDFLTMCKKGRLYYSNKNDIKRKSRKIQSNNPLKTADNRISMNWHGLLVDQKAGYMFGKEPAVDVGKKDINKEITRVLGDEWGKTLKELVVEASNCGKSWIHYWEDSNEKLQYALVPAEQIDAIYSDDLKKRVIGILRRYILFDSNGKKYTKIEYWDKEKCQCFKLQDGKYSNFYVDKENTTNTFIHPHNKVPFIYFNNNPSEDYDLYMYKDLVDKLDESISDFANDIDDVQEIIFILKGYGGEELTEFMRDLKVFKAVKVEDNGDVRTIKAEIPTEARTKMFNELKEAIFLFGMGVNPNKEGLGDSSGVALKFLYALLELKASKTRTEFDCSIKVLIRAILHNLNITDNDDDISMTYYKNMVTNDKEVVEILSKSTEIISNRTKTKNHPYTENLDNELEQLEKEENSHDYDDNFGKVTEDGADDNE